MKSSRNHSLEAFLAIMSMDAMDAAKVTGAAGRAVASNPMRPGHDSFTHSKSAAGAAHSLRFPGDLPTSAQPPRP